MTIAYPLSVLIFLPLITAIIALFLSETQRKILQFLTICTTALQLLISIDLVRNFDTTQQGISNLQNFQFVEHYHWIEMSLGTLGKLSISYLVGLDGLNISLVLLASIVMLIGAIASHSIQYKVKGYYILYLILSSTIMGCFVALDFFLFFLFFEFMLLPMYFLIGIWGGVQREYASLKFFIYTFIGSIFILIVMIGLYTSTYSPQESYQSYQAISKNIDYQSFIKLVQQQKIEQMHLIHSFNLVEMANGQYFLPQSVFHQTSDSQLFNVPLRSLAFLLLLIGFAIKLPTVPFHTWLPYAHVEAPTPISVILAGILLKIGGYGFLRTAFCIFPQEMVNFAFWIGVLGVLSIVYGAWVALGQTHLKKLIAYSSISHMGFVLLGFASCTSEGVQGAVYQMFSHGILSSMLFIVAGVLYDRTHDLEIEHYKGLMIKMPNYSIFVIIAFFASLGLPAFSGFMAELIVFLGAFKSQSFNGLLPRWLVVFAMSGLLLGAGYYLWTIQRMFLGKFSLKNPNFENKLTDLKAIEYVTLIPLAILALIFGLFPNFLLQLMAVTVNHLVEWTK